MAEAVLELALDNLTSLIQEKIGLFLGFEKDFKSLSSLITTIKATLEDAEEKQFTDKAVKVWLLKLKDAAYVLDDILDECVTNARELEYRGSMGGLHGKLQSSCLSSLHPKQVAFRYKIAKKMKSIRERLDEIAEEKTKFHLTEIVREKRRGVLDWRQTTSIISQPQVYGRDEDKDKIVDFLVGEASGLEDLSVCPIVGLGGLGKTTLAQLIFNHERVVQHFESRMWVCVSEDFSLKRITKAIIEAETKKSCEDLDLEPLQRRLQDLLQGNRFLLVLDDVWDDKQENWQRLRSVLACGGKGASILVTTRLAKVAEIMGTIPSHDISKLSDKDCWELFKHRAFGSNEERTKLVVIGKEILKKCGGVPLAAIALGSLLRFKTEEKEWHYVKESKLWSLQGEDYVMSALRLSYLNLPLKLRQCFAFCALFPKDAIIRKQFLIELWMANGFISSNKILDEEDIGNDVWNELYCRSFFQDIETDVFGKITSFKMHDLVHDLAQSISDEVCCITKNDDMPSTFEKIRHLSFGNRTTTKVDSILMYNVKLLRTYTSLYCHEYHLNVLKFHYLRVLKLTCVTRIPSSFSHLKFLRYLDLSVGEFETLPASLCKLWNLQILKLHYCRNLRKLPNNLIRLKSLQHLYLFGCFRLSSLPPNIGKLTSLRTLSMYVVGKGNLLAELGQLNFKVNEFHIKHLERVKNVEDAKEANMLSKHVNNLRLSWDEESQLQENVEQILEVLQPCTQQLQELWVEGYTGFHFPEWMSSPSLIHLRSLYLKNCKTCLHLPQLGKLPSLKELTILGCSELEIDDLGKLPSLKELTIWSCSKIEGLGEDLQHATSLQSLSLLCLPNLTSLPDSLGNLCSLQKLGIRDCPKLICLPASIQSLSALKSLSICGCPELEKRCKRETGEDWRKISHIQNLHGMFWISSPFLIHFDTFIFMAHLNNVPFLPLS